MKRPRSLGHGSDTVPSGTRLHDDGSSPRAWPTRLRTGVRSPPAGGPAQRGPRDPRARVLVESTSHPWTGIGSRGRHGDAEAQKKDRGQSPAVEVSPRRGSPPDLLIRGRPGSGVGQYRVPPCSLAVARARASASADRTTSTAHRGASWLPSRRTSARSTVAVDMRRSATGCPSPPCRRSASKKTTDRSLCWSGSASPITTFYNSPGWHIASKWPGAGREAFSRRFSVAHHQRSAMLRFGRE